MDDEVLPSEIGAVIMEAIGSENGERYLGFTAKKRLVEEPRSSLVAGFRVVISVISAYVCWWVGHGDNIDFWHDRWLESAMKDLLHISEQVAKSLKAKVSDFIVQGQWCIPPCFKTAFPAIARQIEGVRSLWLASIASIFWGLWIQKNALKFEDNVERLIFGVISWVREAGFISKASMYNSVHDLMIIKKFGVPCLPRKAPKILEVKWHPPLRGWIKCNTDGFYKNGIAACGGLFRDWDASVYGVFAYNIGSGNAYVAEFMVVIIAVKMAHSKGWRKIWFEMDSTITLSNFFNRNYTPPWKLQRRWEACWSMLDDMEVRSSHIFREGNVLADILSNMALRHVFFVWWDSVIDDIKVAVSEDRLGFDGEDFLLKNKGKKIMFIGDSVSLNQWQSLLCLLHAALPQAQVTQYTNAPATTVTYQVLKDMDRMVAFRKALTTWAAWVNTVVDPRKTKVFFQGISPVHYNGKEWNEAGVTNCGKETEPIKGSTYPSGLPPASLVLKQVLGTIKKPIYLLDITTLSQLRKDAHPSSYNAFKGMDCTHWCVAGLPDTWNQLLYSALIWG
ncbi:hypothetical protein LguiA_010759 [Lonicera macranthoides]